MTVNTETNKADIVREVINLINENAIAGTEFGTNHQVCMMLKDRYGYDRAQATELLIGAELINELGLSV